MLGADVLTSASGGRARGGPGSGASSGRRLALGLVQPPCMGNLRSCLVGTTPSRTGSGVGRWWRRCGQPACPEPRHQQPCSTWTGALGTRAGASTSSKPPRRDWEAFFAACGEDELIAEVRLLDVIDDDHDIVLLTARPIRVMPQTLAWLDRYGLRWDLLIMRDFGDYTASPTFKRKSLGEALQGVRPAPRLRGRPRNVAMFHEEGVPPACTSTRDTTPPEAPGGDTRAPGRETRALGRGTRALSRDTVRPLRDARRSHRWGIIGTRSTPDGAPEETNPNAQQPQDRRPVGRPGCAEHVDRVVLGTHGVIIGFGVGIAMTAGSYWFSDRLAIRSARGGG